MGAMPSLPKLNEVVDLLCQRDCRAFPLSALDVLRT